MKTNAAPAVQRDQRREITEFMSGFSLETTPGSAAKIADFREHVRPGDTVYITFLPGSDFNDTIAVARRLRDEGFNPVPHFAARSIGGRDVLEATLRRAAEEAGVDQVLLIGGAVPQPLGEFSDTMQILSTGLLDKYGIRKIGVAGHPEGSPDIPEQAILQALRWKNDFAERTDAQMYIVTQFCFEAEPIIRWDRHIQAEGNRLPVRIGVPGLATLKTLMAHAKACGIGPSMRFVSRQAMNVAKLLTVSAPDKLVTELAAYQANDPKCGITGVHMYPLGGLKKSAEWSYAVADGRFEFNPNGQGFTVEAAPA
ncbi:MAG TPA: methylenetetrahydrofolate reductase [Usitatibacter sp.]|nr:methylenetetrahydrofolate reductase [Usitatibacter sp.]